MSNSPARVLVVDDDHDAWYLIAAQLADVGQGRYVAAWAEDYQSALPQMLANAFDVYLLDYRLGPRIGLELLDEARAGGCVGPILVLTASDDRRIDEEALDVGADDFLVKGDTTPELLDHAIRYAIERAQASTQLMRRSEQLARSNAALAEFGSAISHDLRAPLGVIGNAAELIADDPGLSEDSQALLARMQHTVQRMDGLISDLLDFARVGTAEGATSPVHAGAALDCALDDLREQLRATEVKIDRHPLPVVWGWPRLVEQVFHNLISNALKYRGEAPLEVSVRADQRPDGLVEFEVADNGRGIDPERAEEVFSMFCRLDAEGAIPGEGVGLALCRRAVESMGGSIYVAPQAPPGAVIRFTLPSERPR